MMTRRYRTAAVVLLLTVLSGAQLEQHLAAANRPPPPYDFGMFSPPPTDSSPPPPPPPPPPSAHAPQQYRVPAQPLCATVCSLGFGLLAIAKGTSACHPTALGVPTSYEARARDRTIAVLSHLLFLRGPQDAHMGTPA